MLQSLDQFAFSVLVSLYSFLGIQPLPDSSNDWKVVENWVEQDDGTHKLVIESTSLPSLCREHEDHYVKFPAVNLSINSVYLDGKVYQTNSPNGSWVISDAYFKPVVHCRSIASSIVVRQEIKTYLQYMGFISEYPKIVKPTIGFYFLSSDLFFVATLIIMLIALINGTLIVTSGNLSKFKFSIIQDLSILAVVLIISPGKYFEAELHKSNEVCLALLLLAVYMFGHTVGYVNKKTASVMLPFVAFVYAISIGNKHLMQLLIVTVYPVMVMWMCAVAYRYFLVLKWEEHDRGIYKVQLTIFSTIILAGIYDGVISEFTFNKFVLLPVGYTLLSVFNFMDIVRLLGAQKYRNYVLQDEISQQVSVINNLMQSYDRYQELIHDIKSPLTGLNFALSGAGIKNPEMLVQIKNRLNDLLSKAQLSLTETIPGWIDAAEVVHIWGSFKREYSQRINVEIISSDIPDGFVVWGEHLGLRAIIAELIDNAIKANVEKLSVDILATKDMRCLSVACRNHKATLNKKSTNGESSGKGLKFIANRVEAWSGTFDVETHSYNSELKLKGKIQNPSS